LILLFNTTAVGDPCTDNTAQADSMDALWYGHKYGLVDDAVFDVLWNTCDYRAPTLMATHGGIHLAAAELNDHLLHGTLFPHWNMEGHSSSSSLHEFAQALYNRLSTDPGPNFRDTPECVLALKKFLMSTSKGLSQSWKDLYIDDYSLFAPVTEKEDDDMAAYFSRPDVRRALHVEETPVDSWPYDPNIGFRYKKEYDACNAKATEDALSMIDFYKDIVPRLRTTFIYNGDTDPCVTCTCFVQEY
jgi:cathepsin A (carboxypeptidase C)